MPHNSAACLDVSSSGMIAAGPLLPGATCAMPVGVAVVRPPAAWGCRSEGRGVDAVGPDAKG